MPDIYVDVGPMAYSKDRTKVAAKYAVKAKQVMHDAAAKAIRGSAGFTPDKVGDPTGFHFHFDATLTEIGFGTYQGLPSVTCKMEGVVATYPQNEVFGVSLTGKATIGGGTTDRDVDDRIKAAVETIVTKSVIPALKERSKP